ncbi:MAG: hypothetical protein OXE59_02225 [Bacteroidetes bacterium]|nr:hypothetical protein [Bacteroidota bacterium]MCY4232547.1 hypothetical protein [Bacteroidota bacterium]
MRVLILTLLIVVTVASSFLSVRLRYFNTEFDSGIVTVTWEAEAESDVRSYELFRRSTQNDEFVQIAEVSVRGADVQYSVRDDKLYKSGLAIVDYRLEVVLDNGARQQLAERKVNYTPTAIPRSWGSIKAMFQN